MTDYKLYHLTQRHWHSKKKLQKVYEDNRERGSPTRAKRDWITSSDRNTMFPCINPDKVCTQSLASEQILGITSNTKDISTILVNHSQVHVPSIYR